MQREGYVDPHDYIGSASDATDDVCSGTRKVGIIMIRVTVKKVGVHRRAPFTSFNNLSKPSLNGLAWQVIRYEVWNNLYGGGATSSQEVQYFGSKAPAQTAAGRARKGGPLNDGAWGYTINGVIVL